MSDREKLVAVLEMLDREVKHLDEAVSIIAEQGGTGSEYYAEARARSETAWDLRDQTREIAGKE